jgi:RHS repeat-associated protein
VWSNGPTVLLNYRYDSNGNVTNLWSNTSNGVTNFYQYDALNRLTNVLASGVASAGYKFDSVGNLQALTYGNGVGNSYQYDSLNRLTNLVWTSHATNVGSFYYQLGASGNRTNLNETLGTTNRVYAWSYDSLYRLTNEAITVGSVGTLGYGYDFVGNRTNRTKVSGDLGLTNQTFGFNSNDWLTNTDSYDSNGNTIGSGGKTYQYDALNHLTNITSPSVLLGYDGDGNRVSKTVGGTNFFYLVDDRNPSGYPQVLEEWTAGGGSTNLSRFYNYGFALISQKQGSAVYYFIWDGHGSTRGLLDNNGALSQPFTYDAYGSLIASNGVAQTGYLYCGEQWDPDVGTYFLRSRYLNPNTGRFWTMDTHEGSQENPMSLHKYLYCDNNPANRIDPSGHEDIVEMEFSLISIGVSFGGYFLLHNTSETDFTPNWKDAAGDVKHNFASDELQFPSGSASQIANQMYGDLQQFRHFATPYNIASVSVQGNRAAFTTLGIPGYAMNRINPVNPTVQLVNGPGEDELSAVTLGHHMLVGVRRWRIVIVKQTPPDLRIETEAYDQDNGLLNAIARNSGYGQSKQYEVWHNYLNNIGSHWAGSAGATSSGETHIQAEDVGTQNPWRSQLPKSLQ